MDPVAPGYVVKVPNGPGDETHTEDLQGEANPEERDSFLADRQGKADRNGQPPKKGLANAEGARESG